MNRLRSLLFDVLFYSFTAGICTLCLPLVLMPRWFIIWLQPFHARVVGWLLKVIVGIDMRVEGEIPPGPILVASKHQSVWETIMLGGLLHDPSIVLKQELTWLPIFGQILWRQEMIPIARRGGKKTVRKMVAAARRAIAQGRPVVIFPEGTRQAPGRKGKMHAGVAILYEDLKVPVVPVALNAGYLWGRRQPFKRPGTVTVRFLPPIAPGLPKDVFLKQLQEAIEAGCVAIGSC